MKRPLLLGAAALALTLAPAQAAGRSGPDHGIELIQQGHIRDAVNYYRNLTEQYPNDSAAQTGLGIALEHDGKSQEAREAYERALKLDATDVRAMNNLANLLVEGEVDIPRGKKLLVRAIQLRPGLAIAWDNLGWAFYKEKNFGQATAKLKRALELDPNQASAHYHVGFCYLQSNDFARARPHLARATQLDPSNPRAWMAYGLALQKLDRKDEARNAFKQALGRVDRRSAVGRELVRLINSLGTVAGDSLLSSPDSLFRKYTPTTNTLPAPFQDSNPYRAPGALADAVPPLPGQAAAPPPVAATTSSGLDAPGPVGLPASVLGQRNAGRPAQSLVDALPAPAGTIEPRAGSIILSHHAGGPPAPAVPPLGLPSAAGPASAAPAMPARSTVVTEPPPPVSENAVKQELVSTHLAMAHLYEEKGLFRDAVSEGQTVVNIAPFAREAAEAREIIGRSSGREEQDVKQRVYGLLELGQHFYAQHQLESAILQYEKILVLDPRHAIAFKDLAFLNLKANRLEVAYDQVKKALEIEPDFQEALLIKGHIEARQRQFRASYDTFKKLTELAREGTAMRQYAAGLSQKMRRFVELE